MAEGVTDGITPSVTDREPDEDDVDGNNVVQPGSRESDALLPTLTLCAVAAKPLDGNNDEYKSHARVLAMDLVRQLLEGPSAATWLRRWRSHLRKPLCVAVIRAGSGWDGSKRRGAGDRARVPQGGGFESRGSVGANAPAPKAAKALAPLRALARAAFGTMVIRARKSYKREIAAARVPRARAPPSRTPREVPKGVPRVPWTPITSSWRFDWCVSSRPTRRYSSTSLSTTTAI